MPYYSKKQIILFITIFFALSLFLVGDAYAANWYVDSGVSSSGNGQSWGTAWKNISDITGLSAGDTVYFSGGVKGGAGKSYGGTTVTPTSGTSDNRITYKIGQDSQHNGIATFTTTNFVTVSNVIVSGDAGDGDRHFKWTTAGRPMNNGSYIRISYVDVGSRTSGFYNNGGTGIEIDHIYFKKINGGEDRFAYLNLVGNTWGINSIHDNVVYLINNGSGGYGDDGIQSSPNGGDVYNNTFIGYSDGTYTGTQHQDGMQPLGGGYMRIYNNTFTDIAGISLFFDALYSDFSHIRIYNNVIKLTSTALQANAAPYAIKIVPDGKVFNPAYIGRSPNFTNVKVMNNTIVDYGTNKVCIFFYNREVTGGMTTGLFTNSEYSNNICWNGSGAALEPGMTQSNNVTGSGTGGNHFVSYSPLSVSNDFHLSSNDSLFKDKGTDLSAHFTTDKDNVSRPQGSAWDIGAYEYLSSAPPPPIAASTYEAESCVLASPMQIVSDTAASGGQYIQTSASESGTATCSFSISQADTYKITARVFAPNGGTDSFYFQIDNSPEDTYDLNPTASPSEYNIWREDNLAKRGTGTFDNPQYDPYTINLSSGVHTLTFKGRESNARLDYFYLTRVADITPPSAPSGLIVN